MIDQSMDDASEFQFSRIIEIQVKVDHGDLRFGLSLKLEGVDDTRAVESR